MVYLVLLALILTLPFAIGGALWGIPLWALLSVTASALFALGVVRLIGTRWEDIRNA